MTSPLPPALDAVLRSALTAAAGTATVTSIEPRPFDAVTSYRLDLLRVHLRPRAHLDVLVKDFASSRLPKTDPAARAEREATVYRDLLDGSRLGTARLYGMTRDPVRLLLEHVEGTTLAHHGLPAWFDTATWLGRFHAEMADRTTDVARCRVLIRHDRAFFLAQAHAARTAIAAFGPAAARRLDTILDGYPRLVAAMADQPCTLVHGSFRPQNIIVAAADDAPVRICPVDWELAGLGSPHYDLAFLADGFTGADLDRLLAAYRCGAGTPEPVRSDTVFLLDGYRLHKAVKSIGDSVALAFRPATVEKLLGMGEALRERLG